MELNRRQQYLKIKEEDNFMATELDFEAEEWAMCFNKVSGYYKDPQEAEKIWMAYSEDISRYKLETRARDLLLKVNDSLGLDILLDELIRNEEFGNAARTNVEYPDDEECYVYRTLPSSAARPVILYDNSKRTKLESRFWNKNSARYQAKKSKKKN